MWKLLVFGFFLYANAQVPLYPMKNSKHCVDSHLKCRHWSGLGECERNPSWMKWNCRRACNVCHLRVNCQNGMRVELESDCPLPTFIMSENEINRRMDRFNELSNFRDRLANQSNQTSFVSSSKHVYANEVKLSENDMQSRIYDGKSDYVSHHVQLINHGKRERCGRVAIDSYVVLTVAHCVVNFTNGIDDGSSFWMYVGSVDFAEGTAVRPAKYSIHQEYIDYDGDSNIKREHDIALIKVKDEINPKYIIGLATNSERIGQKAKFTGFGYSQHLPDGDVLPHKMQEYVVIDETSEGRDTTFFTTGHPAPGDSGGALTWIENGKTVVGGLFLGLSDFSDENRSKWHPEYIRISNFHRWIMNEKERFSPGDL